MNIRLVSGDGSCAVWKEREEIVLLAPDQTTNLTSVVVTIDIIEDLVADFFSLQINGNAPAPGGVTNTAWDAQWSQFGLVVGGNNLALWNQAWHALGPDTPGGVN